MANSPIGETQLDRLLGGRLTLRQPKAGHRAGTDALLVAAAAGPRPGDRIIDAGAGVGTIGLALAARQPDVDLTLIERDAALAALAGENAVTNGLASRTTLHVADLLDRDAMAALAGRATLVVSNPPFYAAGTVRASPYPRKAAAYGFEPGATHATWLHALLGLLAPHGRLVMINRPEALPMLCAAAEGRLGALCVQGVQPRAGVAASRILFGGVAGSHAPLTLRAPLVLHEADGGFTAEAEALARGDGAMPLLDPQTRQSRPRGPASS